MYKRIYYLNVCLIDSSKGWRVLHLQPVSDPFFEEDYLHVLLVLNFLPSIDGDMTVVKQLEKHMKLILVKTTRSNYIHLKRNIGNSQVPRNFLSYTYYQNVELVPLKIDCLVPIAFLKVDRVFVALFHLSIHQHLSH